MKLIKTHRKGEIHSTNYIPKSGSEADPQGMNHAHVDLSPFAKQPTTHGTFDVPTKHKIDRKQKKEMHRNL